ncbi:MAG: glycosyltransferase, partial [Planctomycetota bacterium]
ISDDTDAILFVGRLSHHAKSNPLPLFVACQRAHERTGRQLVLILSGWYANDAVRQGFEQECARLAPRVNLIYVDGMDPEWRDSIWAAGDLFVSLADSVQETFGLTVVEAMSRGLPVIATDWNGYRETIQHEETGLLIPTAIVNGSAERSLQMLHEGHLSYDQFLASAGQSVIVDTEAVTDAITRLIASPETRFSLARAGQEHARSHFDWSVIVPKYEEVWNRQRTLLRRMRARPSAVSVPSGPIIGLPPTVVPSFRSLFWRYPSTWIDVDQSWNLGTHCFGDFASIESSPLAGHAPQWRLDSQDTAKLIKSIGDRTVATPAHPTRQDAVADTLGWALKYDLIRRADATELRPRTTTSLTESAQRLTLVTTCRGRLDHLRCSLPRMLAQPNCDVLVVDYSCPQQTSGWIEANISHDNLQVVNVFGKSRFDRSDARNRGWSACQTQWIALIDADVLLSDDFADQVFRRLRARALLRCVMATSAEGLGGLIVVERSGLEAIGGFDPVFRGWGEEDEDVVDALIFHGSMLLDLPDSIAQHIDHDDRPRDDQYSPDSFYRRRLINRLYRVAKWDLARSMGQALEESERRLLYQKIERKMEGVDLDETDVELTIDSSAANSATLRATFRRRLSYLISSKSAEQPPG